MRRQCTNRRISFLEIMCVPYRTVRTIFNPFTHIFKSTNETLLPSTGTGTLVPYCNTSNQIQNKNNPYETEQYGNGTS